MMSVCPDTHIGKFLCELAVREVLRMSNFHKVFHLAALAAAGAIVIAATQDLSADPARGPIAGYSLTIVSEIP